jgi:hypothetical protein
LNLLVEQSERGKYALSEIGQTSMALFRKVEREQQRTSKIVEKEIDNYVWRHFWNAIFWCLLIFVSLAIPISVDITLSVQTIYETFSFWQMATLHVAGYATMALCLTFFVIFDRHYYSKNQKTSIIHTTIFAAATSAFMLITFTVTYNFMQTTIEMAGTATKIGTQWLTTQLLMVISRTAAYITSAPLVAYAINKLSKKR